MHQDTRRFFNIARNVEIGAPPGSLENGMLNEMRQTFPPSRVVPRPCLNKNTKCYALHRGDAVGRHTQPVGYFFPLQKSFFLFS